MEKIKKFIQSKCTKILFLSFIFYAFLGWIYEVLLGIFIFHYGFVNRGFLFGPWLPIYGFGALIIISMKKIKKYGLAATFFITTIITTLIELISSYIMEAVIGRWLWNYDGYFLNFQGRIALSSSLRFGLFSVVLIYLIQPWLEKKITGFDNKKSNIFAVIIAILFFVDCLARLWLGSNFTATTNY